MKKFELTNEFVTNMFGTKLFRIRALVEFGDVEAGELGGYVEKESNLDHDDNAWVCDNAWVYGNARVYGDALVCGNTQVFGNAWVYGNAWVSGNALVYGDALVYGNAWVCGDARVCGNGDYAYARGFGSVNRTTTFFRLKDGGVGVRCGCFYGTLAQFRDKIRETHGETKKAQEYLMLADLMELRFEEDENEVGNRKYVE